MTAPTNLKRPLGLGEVAGDTREDTAPAEYHEQAEHNNDRRRFLIWACMAGYVKPERVVERIVAEVESESAG